LRQYSCSFTKLLPVLARMLTLIQIFTRI